MTIRHVTPFLILTVGLRCTDASGPNLTFKNAAVLAAQLDTIDAAFASPQLKSLSRLALPLLSDGITVKTMDASMLGRTLEWDPIQRRMMFTDRPGVPTDAIQLILYTLDAAGLPAVPKSEIGYAYLVPRNASTGGGPNNMSLRFVVFRTPNPNPSVAADWTVTRRPADTACGQCATISGVVGTGGGPRLISFTIPYYIPLNADGNFAGIFTGAGFAFAHSATLPGPSSSSATADLAFSFAGDSITTTSGPLLPHAAELDGETEVMINGEHYATARRTAGTTSVTGPSRFLSSGAERHAITGLFAVPADIADYIEWPTFAIFFCGC